jgi:hypothetical protein
MIDVLLEPKLDYIPKFNSFTGGAIETLILMLCLKEYRNNNNYHFSKFFKPTKHPSYIKGKSWIEELNIDEQTFISHFQNIAFRDGGKNKIEKDKALIFFYKNKTSGLIFFYPNIELINNYIHSLFNPDISYKNEKSLSTDLPQYIKDMEQNRDKIIEKKISNDDLTHFEYFKKNSEIKFNSWLYKNKRSIPNMKEFIDYFNNKAVLEDLEFDVNKIMARLNILVKNWKTNGIHSEISKRLPNQNNNGGKLNININDI